MATPLLLMSSTTTEDRNPSSQPEPRPGPNPPKSRGRKSKTQNGAPKKQPQRGMGVAQLERLLRQQQQNSPHHHTHNINPHQPGFAHYGFPVYLGGSGHSEMRPPIRVLEGHTSTELPSMPNTELEGYMIDQHSTIASLSHKKKRVIGDEVGFLKEKDKYDDQIIVPSNGYNCSGFDRHHHAVISTGGGFSGYDYLAGTEVVAIHKKGNESGNVMMEYGFFPGIHEENEGWKINNGCINITHNRNHNDNYYYEMTDLNLKMGLWSDSSSPSPSSSSLSSLTTATTYSATAARRTATTGAASNTCSLDLSLKLSY